MIIQISKALLILIFMSCNFLRPLTTISEPNAQKEEDIEVQTGSPIEIEMVEISGGVFTMGCTEEISECFPDEEPTHKVTLDGFQIAKYELTQELWREVMGSDPEHLKFKGCDKCPVESIYWADVQEFITKLNEKTNKNYRLPTEAEWEYAARGGEEYKFAGSNNMEEVGWTRDNANNKTRAVGLKKPNGYGLYDMSGNVYELCSDYKGDYTGEDQKNPTGITKPTGHVMRGGGWFYSPWYCRVSARQGISINIKRDHIGFRLAHDIEK